MNLSRIYDRRRRRRFAPSLTSSSTRTERPSKRSRPLSGPFQINPTSNSRLRRAIGDAGQPYDPLPADAADEVGLGIGGGLGMAAERGIKLFGTEQALLG